MNEDDVRAVMRHDFVATASDGSSHLPGSGDQPHPRAYGTFPRKIRKYVVEEHVIPLETAIHSMTGLPAAVFHVADRGELRPGAFADVVVFDLAKVRDKATYTQPHQLSEGMVYVLVNGTVAVDGGKVTDARGGRVLRR